MNFTVECRYILYSLVTLLLNCLRLHVRLFVTTVVIIKSTNVTPVDDYKERR